MEQRPLPEIPQSWKDFTMQVAQLVTLLITLVAAIAGLKTGWNNEKKLEEHGAVLEKAAEKTEEVKKAVDKIQ